jgi:putative transposase
MKTLVGYKVELDPNNVQATSLLQHAGAARFIYNWGLEQRISLWASEKKSTDAMKQHKELNLLKKSVFSWLYTVSKAAPQEALRDLDKAFKNFFRRIKQGSAEPGFPKFKSRHTNGNHFRLTGSIKVEGNYIQLPRIGKVKLKETGYIPNGESIKSVSVRQQAGRWYISCLIEKEIKQYTLTDEVIGVDLGIKTLAVCSDGLIFENPKALNKKEEKLKRVQRELSRRNKGGMNRTKSKKKLQKVHKDISNIRNDNLHKVTTAIVRTKPSTIVIEDLAVKNMVKNHKLAKSVSDASFGEFRRQLEYKCTWAGINLVIANRFFPSSKMCSGCGQINDSLKLSDRVYSCDCGISLDRDLNASYNLRNYFTDSLSGINAFGDGKVHAMKQVAVVELGNKQEMVA